MKARIVHWLYDTGWRGYCTQHDALRWRWTHRKCCARQRQYTPVLLAALGIGPAELRAASAQAKAERAQQQQQLTRGMQAAVADVNEKMHRLGMLRPGEQVVLDWGGWPGDHLHDLER